MRRLAAVSLAALLGAGCQNPPRPQPIQRSAPPPSQQAGSTLRGATGGARGAVQNTQDARRQPNTHPAPRGEVQASPTATRASQTAQGAAQPAPAAVDRAGDSAGRAPDQASDTAGGATRSVQQGADANAAHTKTTGERAGATTEAAVEGPR